ncbi:MAG: class I SAM-dependent methyltransferase [Candidatus Diapherotrites archaeon]
MEKFEYKKLFELEEEFFWNSFLRKLVHERIKDFSGKKNLMILDAGCGTGILAKELSATVKVMGLDLSMRALLYCRKRGLRNLVNAPIEKLPFKNNSFDAVLSLDVLCHKWVESDLKALKEFNRVLKKKGIIIINEPAFNLLYSAHDKAVHIRHRYTKKELKEKIIKEGFAIEKIVYWNSLLFPLITIFRLIKNLSKDRESDLMKLHPTVNRLLLSILSFESKISKKIRLPLGLSLFCVAKKIEE